MKQHNIYLRNRVHAANLYVGTVCQSLSVRLNRRITEMNVYIRELPVRDDISVTNRFILTAHPALTELHKCITLDESGIVLGTEMGRQILRTVFETCSNTSQLNAVLGDISSSKEIYDIENGIVLAEQTLSAVREVFCACEDLLSMWESTYIGAELTMYAGADNEISMVSAAGATSAIKGISISHCLQIVSELNASMERLCSAEESEMQMSGSVDILVTIYRKIFDMDKDENDADLYLDDFDDTSLENIDYIVL